MSSEGSPARNVVITGVTAGGRLATAHRFAREGDRIGLIARDEIAAGAFISRGTRSYEEHCIWRRTKIRRFPWQCRSYWT